MLVVQHAARNADDQHGGLFLCKAVLRSRQQRFGVSLQKSRESPKNAKTSKDSRLADWNSSQKPRDSSKGCKESRKRANLRAMSPSATNQRPTAMPVAPRRYRSRRARIFAAKQKSVETSTLSPKMPSIFSPPSFVWGPPAVGTLPHEQRAAHDGARFAINQSCQRTRI